MVGVTLVLQEVSPPGLLRTTLALLSEDEALA